jgi:hypothetical protein
MFNLRLTTRREILLWTSTIEDLKAERARLVAEAKHERERAEAILNILLARTTGVVVAKPDADEMVNRQQQDILDLFGGDEAKEEEILNKVQS